jgi:hypothetical protein
VPVGNDGETLVADSSTSTGLRYQGSMAAARNGFINGGLDIWQRGTSISIAASTSAATYTADRWCTQTGANQAITVSRQATGDTTNLPNIQYCTRYQRNSGQTGTGNLSFSQSFETINSVPLAGKAVTFSFYARAGANFSATSNVLNAWIYTGTGTDQNVLSGYTGALTPIFQTATLTTTWQRFTFTGTIATNVTEIAPYFLYAPTGTAGTNDYYEITGVQVEASQSSTASAFSTNGATYQAELAACQRYYWRTSSDATATIALMVPAASAKSSVVSIAQIQYPVPMRTTPTSMDTANLSFVNYADSFFALTSIAFNASATNNLMAIPYGTIVAGTAGHTGKWQASSSAAAYIGFSAEL